MNSIILSASKRMTVHDRSRKIDEILSETLPQSNNYERWKLKVGRIGLLNQIQAELLTKYHVFITVADLLIRIRELEIKFEKTLQSFNMMKDFSNPYVLERETRHRFSFFFILKDAMEPFV